MIDYNLLLSLLTDNCGMPSKHGTIYAISRQEYTGRKKQYIIKDMIFFHNINNKHTAKKYLNCLFDEYIPNNRNDEANKILKSVCDYYNFKLFSVLMSSHSCKLSSLSFEMKEYIKTIWNELKPDEISTKWWNNNFFKLLQTKESPTLVKKTILKQVKQPTKLLRIPKLQPVIKPKKKQVLFLNIESTGINLDDEVIQISISGKKGKILFNQMIKPEKEITERATEINGITNKMLADEKNIKYYADEIKSILEGNVIYAYRVDFDERLLKQSFEKYEIDTDFFNQLDTRNTQEYRNHAHIAGENLRDSFREKGE